MVYAMVLHRITMYARLWAYENKQRTYEGFITITNPQSN